MKLKIIQIFLRNKATETLAGLFLVVRYVLASAAAIIAFLGLCYIIGWIEIKIFSYDVIVKFLEIKTSPQEALEIGLGMMTIFLLGLTGLIGYIIFVGIKNFIEWIQDNWYRAIREYENNK